MKVLGLIEKNPYDSIWAGKLCVIFINAIIKLFDPLYVGLQRHYVSSRVPRIEFDIRFITAIKILINVFVFNLGA